MNPYETRQIRTGIDIPVLGLGAGGLNHPVHSFSIAGARKTLSAAWEAGIRYFDTAPMYAYGMSERLIGDLIRERDGTVFVSTKVGRLLKSNFPPDSGEPPISRVPFGLGFDYTRDGTLRSIEDSLQRIGVDRISVALIHDIDEVTHGDGQPQRFREAMAGALPALLELKNAGVIGAVGLGVNQARVCLDVMREADIDCILIAGRYTLLDNDILDDLIPLCRERDVKIIVGGPFNSGVLAAPATGATFDYQPVPPAIREKVRRIKLICDSFGVPLPAAALQFPVAERSVASVVPGARTMDEVRQNVAYFEASIPPELWNALKNDGILRADASVPS